MRGAFLDSQTLSPEDLDFSKLTSTLPKWDLYSLTPPEQVMERLQSVNIAVTNKVALTAKMFQSLPTLECICVAATGYDHIDIKAAREKGIVVCNVIDYSTYSVVQHTIGLMINLASRLNDYARLVNEGAWASSTQFCVLRYKTMELNNKVLGIVGYGRIGKGVAKAASALGMKVLTTHDLPLEKLLSEVDMLSLHCPLNDKTRHLIGKKELLQMKKGAFVVNTSRGGLIDEDALANALTSGHLGGAAVDVLSKEPPLTENPLLRQLPNLIVTPHVAWSTLDARQRLLDSIVKNIDAYLAKEPQHVVN